MLLFTVVLYFILALSSSRARKRETAPERSDGDPNGVSGNAANNLDGCAPLHQKHQKPQPCGWGFLFVALGALI